MKRWLYWTMLVAFCLLFVSCGYFSSGQWEDDPKNWHRAWGYSKPPDVEMAHSWYWRSPHWTREEAYFFEFRRHDELFQEIIRSSRMGRVETKNGQRLEPKFCFDKPKWFAPKAISEYESWNCKDGADCWLFRDRSSGDLFFYACQL